MCVNSFVSDIALPATEAVSPALAPSPGFEVQEVIWWKNGNTLHFIHYCRVLVTGEGPKQGSKCRPHNLTARRRPFDRNLAVTPLPDPHEYVSK